MIVRELITLLGFKVDDSKLKNFEQSINNLKDKLKDVRDTFLVVGATTTAVTAGIAAMSLSVAKAIDATDLLSSRIGVSATVLQELDIAGQRAGLGIGEVEKSLAFLSSTANKASESSKGTNDDFKKLGISLKDSNGTLKDSVSLYSEVATKIESIANPLKKAELSQRLLGNSSRDLTAFIGQSSEALATARAEAAKLATIIDSKGIKSAKEFGKSWNDFRIIVDGFTKQIAFKFMPIFTDLMKKFKDWYILNKDIIQQGLEGFVTKLGFALNVLGTIVNILVTPIRKLVDVLGSAENAIRVLGVALSIGLIPILFNTAKQFFELGKSMYAAMFTPVGRMIALFSAIGLVIGLVYDDVKHWVEGNGSLIGRLLGDWKTFQIKFDQIIDKVKSTINKVVEAFGGVSNVGKALGLLVGGLLFNKLYLLASAFKTVGSSIGFLIPVVSTLFNVFRALALGLTATPLGWLVLGIAAVGTAFVLLKKDIKEWVAGNDSAIEKVLGKWDEFKVKIDGVWQAVKDGVKNTLFFIGDASSQVFDGIIAAAEKSINIVRKLFGLIGDKPKAVPTDPNILKFSGEVKDVSKSRPEFKDKNQGIISVTPIQEEELVQKNLARPLRKVDSSVDEEIAPKKLVKPLYKVENPIDEEITPLEFQKKLQSGALELAPSLETLEIFKTEKLKKEIIKEETSLIKEKVAIELIDESNLLDETDALKNLKREIIVSEIGALPDVLKTSELKNNVGSQEATFSPSVLPAIPSLTNYTPGVTNTSNNSSKIINNNVAPSNISINITASPGTTAEQSREISEQVMQAIEGQWIEAKTMLGAR